MKFTIKSNKHKTFCHSEMTYIQNPFSNFMHSKWLSKVENETGWNFYRAVWPYNIFEHKQTQTNPCYRSYHNVMKMTFSKHCKLWHQDGNLVMLCLARQSSNKGITTGASNFHIHHLLKETSPDMSIKHMHNCMDITRKISRIYRTLKIWGVMRTPV